MSKDDFQFELYDPMEDEVIAGPVDAEDHTEAARKLLDVIGYIIREVEIERDEDNEQR